MQNKGTTRPRSISFPILGPLPWIPSASPIYSLSLQEAKAVLFYVKISMESRSKKRETFTREKTQAKLKVAQLKVAFSKSNQCNRRSKQILIVVKLPLTCRKVQFAWCNKQKKLQSVVEKLYFVFCTLIAAGHLMAVSPCNSMAPFFPAIVTCNFCKWY